MTASTPGQPATAGALLEELARFDGPMPEFLASLVEAQRALVGAREAVILFARVEDGSVDAVAASPTSIVEGEAPDWLARAAAACPGVAKRQQAETLVLQSSDGLYDEERGRRLVLTPISRSNPHDAPFVGAFVLDRATNDGAAAAIGQLALTALLAPAYEARAGAAAHIDFAARLRAPIETLGSVNAHDRFGAAAMALCDEVMARYKCDRASLALLRGATLKLEAMSHTERIVRKTNMVQQLEAAMEECLDQDVETAHPATSQATFINRAAREYAMAHGPRCLLSLPLRRDGQAVGVLTVERSIDEPFYLEDVESLRLCCDLLAPRLLELHDRDAWFGARAARRGRKLLANVWGAEHTWIKLAAVLTSALLLFSIFVHGTRYVRAPFTIAPGAVRIIPAPFDGRLARVSVDIGDRTQADQTVLAELDASDLRLELAAQQAELTTHQRALAAAQREGDAVLGQIETARADQSRARIALLEHRIESATLLAPIDGVVAAGDLKSRVGAPVQAGETLFEIVSNEDNREARLQIPESRVAELPAGAAGQLVIPAYPDQPVAFTIEHIDPVARVVGGHNVFTARAQLETPPDWLRPGMEGAARINVGRARYIQLWTKPILDWLRLRLWL